MQLLFTGYIAAAANDASAAAAVFEATAAAHTIRVLDIVRRTVNRLKRVDVPTPIV